MKYNWQHPHWPKFSYESESFQHLIYQYSQELGALTANLDSLAPDLRDDTVLDLMVVEALKSSEIEGENLDAKDLRSSIQRQLGLSSSSLKIRDVRSQGMGKLMVEVRKSWHEVLTEDALFLWHRLLFENQKKTFEIGSWRTHREPMQIVSGAIGREKIHFEAPPSTQVPNEMKRFIHWFNDSHPKSSKVFIPGPVRAALVHLYFESIHPFGDGNGRIGRALAEKVLSQDCGSAIPFSLSVLLQKKQKAYYEELAHASRMHMDVTQWIHFFVQCVYEALIEAKHRVGFSVQKLKFWNTYHDKLNERQEKVLNRVLEGGPESFEGGLTAKKYMAIASCSKATATRELGDLLEKGCLVQLPGAGRNTRYEVLLK